MWAQLIQMRLKPGEDTAEMIELIRTAEQPGSGLVRSLFMRDQADPSRIVTLVVFETEEKARARRTGPAARRATRCGQIDDGRHLRGLTDVHRPGGRRRVDRHERVSGEGGRDCRRQIHPHHSGRRPQNGHQR
jgi:hypothetical protein